MIMLLMTPVCPATTLAGSPLIFLAIVTWIGFVSTEQANTHKFYMQHMRQEPLETPD